MEDLNILSLVLSTLIPMIMGMIWYSDALFGKPWKAAIGMTDEKAKSGNMPLMMGLGVLTAAIISFFLTNFNNSPGQEGQFDTFGHGAVHGIVLSLFIVIPIFISKGVFEQKSWKYIAITSSFWMICLALMGGIVDVMHHWPNEYPTM